MKVTVIAVGRSPASLHDLIDDFEARARRYWKLEVIEIPSGAGGGGSRDEPAVLRAEAQRFRERIPKGTEIWALTRGGREFSSAELARELEDRAIRSAPGVTFLIGGAFGLDPGLLAEAKHRIALSRLTLPHGMARMFLAEQLYRAGTILKNEPYHKGKE